MENNRGLTSQPPKIVIVGAGFGGLSAATMLKKAEADITIIDRHNYHLFQPLLYQVATAALSPADIAAPIRHVVANAPQTRVLLDNVVGVDRQSREVITTSRRVPFDYLILATGAQHSYFGKDEWAEHAPGLKTIDDATSIRRKILLAFEVAEMASTPDERDAALTFIVVGGGPTGVEMAGAIAELAHHALANDFRNVSSNSAKILLVEAGTRVLPTFPESLSDKALSSLQKLNVEVLVNTRVEDIDKSGVVMNGARVNAATVIWAAGVRASPAGQWLNAPTDRAGRVTVRENLTIPDDDRIFVIGDTASYTAANGKVLPGVAPVAKQQGQFVAKVIKARLKGKSRPEQFKYRDYGNLATIGRKKAVVDFGFWRVNGFTAWLIWSIAHVYFLIGFRNRLVVAMNWIWQYLTFQRGARLITGDESPAHRDLEKIPVPRTP